MNRVLNPRSLVRLLPVLTVVATIVFTQKRPPTGPASPSTSPVGSRSPQTSAPAHPSPGHPPPSHANLLASTLAARLLAPVSIRVHPR